LISEKSFAVAFLERLFRGRDWTPSSHSVLCNLHYENGEGSTRKEKINVLPTTFVHCYFAQDKLVRYDPEDTVKPPVIMNTGMLSTHDDAGEKYYEKLGESK
jgi:hypothetical protein